MNTLSEYRHTQRGPWFALLYLLSVLFIGLSLFLPDFPPRYVFFFVGMLLAPLAASVHHLTIEDVGDHLWIHFGPLPLFNLRIDYNEIVSVEAARTTLLDGWGIHWSLRGGWVWNIWGRNCVVIRLRNQVLFVGTNDSEGLIGHLQSKASSRQKFGDLLIS